MDQVEVQYQSKTGNWTTVMVVQNLAPNILNTMKTVARANPDAASEPSIVPGGWSISSRLGFPVSGDRDAGA